MIKFSYQFIIFRKNNNRKQSVVGYDLIDVVSGVPQGPVLFNNGRYITNFPTDTTTDIKKNMHHIHTYIVSRISNNKILHTLPPHISSSEGILSCLTCYTIAQLKTNISPV